MAFIRAGGEAVGSAAKNAGLSAKLVTAMRSFKNVARVLTVIAVNLDDILLIYEAIEGAQQRTALRECVTVLFIFFNVPLILYASRAVVELCARRFDIQKMHRSIMACDSFTNTASSIIKLRKEFDKFGSNIEEAANEFVKEEIKRAAKVSPRAPFMLVEYKLTNLRCRKWMKLLMNRSGGC